MHLGPPGVGRPLGEPQRRIPGGGAPVDHGGRPCARGDGRDDRHLPCLRTADPASPKAQGKGLRLPLRHGDGEPDGAWVAGSACAVSDGVGGGALLGTPGRRASKRRTPSRRRAGAAGSWPALRPAAPCRTSAHPMSPTPRAGRTSVLPWPPAAPRASSSSKLVRSKSAALARKIPARCGAEDAVPSAVHHRLGARRTRGDEGVEALSERGLVAGVDPVGGARGRGPHQVDLTPPEGVRPGGVLQGVGEHQWRRRPRVYGLDSDGWAGVGGPGSTVDPAPRDGRTRFSETPRPGTGMAAASTAGGALVATATAGTDTVTGPPGPTEAVRSSRDSGRPPAARSWPRGCWQRTCSVPGSPGVAGSANDASRMGTGTGGRTPGPAEPVAQPLHRPNQSDCATR